MKRLTLIALAVFISACATPKVENNAEAYGNRGYAYFSLDQPDRGCHDLQKACELGNCDGLRWAENNGFCR
jgi:Tfp pilus assembly protein PilF